MKRILIATALSSVVALPSLAASPPPALTADQSERVRCVAALALVANDQQRGAPGWEGFPWLPERGKHFAGLTGDALVTETGRDRDAIKAEILNAIAALQKLSVDVKDPQAATGKIVRSCITLMDRLDPPPAPPTLPQCAAMVALAYQQVSGRDGNSRSAKELSNIAAILDSKARDQLLAEGRTANESDVIIGMVKETMIAEAAVNRANGDADTLDIETCYQMAGKK